MARAGWAGAECAPRGPRVAQAPQVLDKDDDGRLTLAELRDGFAQEFGGLMPPHAQQVGPSEPARRAVV